MIFISYRRADSLTITGRIYDELVRQFGKNKVFKDVDAIPFGKDFRAVIHHQLAKAEVVLVIIGPHWGHAQNEQGLRRLDHPDDFVRIEIETALHHPTVEVIPVLVQHAKMPTAQELPLTLQDLAYRNAVVIRDDPDFHRDMDRLLGSLKARKKRGRRRLLLLLPVVVMAIVLAAIWGSGLLDDNQDDTPEPSQQAQADDPTATSTDTPAVNCPPEAVGCTKVTANNDWSPMEQTTDDGVVMVLVPSGCFMMGSEQGDDDETPVTEICFDTPFWIDKFEVTNEQFEQLGGGAAQPSTWTEPTRPRENITWFEAAAYCTARAGRLPTEAEWEYAARGPSNWVYPWGNFFFADNVVFEENSNNQTAPVGSIPNGQSWSGALDMSGNVWEWTSSLASFPYPYDATDGRENPNDRANARTIRGGSWTNIQYNVRATDRFLSGPSQRTRGIGLRCVMEWRP